MQCDQKLQDPDALTSHHAGLDPGTLTPHQLFLPQAVVVRLFWSQRQERLDSLFPLFDLVHCSSHSGDERSPTILLVSGLSSSAPRDPSECTVWYGPRDLELPRASFTKSMSWLPDSSPCSSFWWWSITSSYMIASLLAPHSAMRPPSVPCSRAPSAVLSRVTLLPVTSPSLLKASQLQDFTLEARRLYDGYPDPPSILATGP